MIIDITRLKSGVVDNIDIDEEIIIDKEQLENSTIIELDKVKLNGFLTKTENDYYLNINVKGKMVIPCSVSLKPTDHHFEFEIDGNVKEMLEEIGKTLKNLENTIDIFPILWENILMEIPIRVVNEDIQDVKLEGNGWRMIKEDESFVNPELEKLKDLLK